MEGLPELPGRHAGVLGELLVEVILGVIPHHLGDAGDGQVCGDQQVLGLPDAAAQQVLPGGIAAGLLEHMGQVVGADVESLPDLLEGQGLAVVAVDIVLHLFPQGRRLRISGGPEGDGAGDGQGPVQQRQHQPVAKDLAVGPVLGEIAVDQLVQGPQVGQLPAHRIDRGRVLRHQGILPQPRQAQPAHGDAAAGKGCVGQLVMDHAAVEYQKIARLYVVSRFADQEAGASLLDQQHLHKVGVGVEQPGMGLIGKLAAADVEQPGHGVRGKGGLVVPLDKALYL